MGIDGLVFSHIDPDQVFTVGPIDHDEENELSTTLASKSFNVRDIGAKPLEYVLALTQHHCRTNCDQEHACDGISISTTTKQRHYVIQSPNCVHDCIDCVRRDLSQAHHLAPSLTVEKQD